MSLWKHTLSLVHPQGASSLGVIVIDLRTFCATAPGWKKQGGSEGFRDKLYKIYKKKTYDERDRNKMPSEVEIAKKGLPKNTPTLGERIDRDVYHYFHQADQKHGYHNIRKTGQPLLKEVLEDAKYELKTRPWQSFKENFKIVYEEVKKENAIIKAHVLDPGKAFEDFPQIGKRKKEWGFQKEEDIDQWILTKDSDWGEGYSSANFEMNPLGYARLHGDLSTRVPADGRTQAAGYVNICSVPKMRTFAREALMEHWYDYTHLTMNVRGDGRKYMLNIQVKRDFDVVWNDRWHYPLYTRGGPYWQYVKIPWSKFFLGHRGNIQDKQYRVPLNVGVVGLSLTLMDGISGPYQLEIKDISLHNDPTEDDEMFTYETYKTPDYWAGS